MPWRDAISIPFTHIDIVARVPSESGVYAILDRESCIFVGESWNLKARLLELAAAVSDVSHLTIKYELCSDEGRTERKNSLMAELVGDRSHEPVALMDVPGISFSIPAEQ
jgi:hypothetical protein